MGFVKGRILRNASLNKGEGTMKLLQSVERCYIMLNSWLGTTGQGYRAMLKQIVQHLANHMTAAVLAVVAMYLSLLTTSLPPAPQDRPKIDSAIELLKSKGFEQEAFLLKRTVTFRSTDHWLNSLIRDENAYASTNFPFHIITLYGDFYTKTVDDTERAMVLLHEARHLLGENENEAYAYVWRNRHQLGWTLETHGTTPSYVSIEQITREIAPEVFNCPDKMWMDCTEMSKNASRRTE